MPIVAHGKHLNEGRLPFRRFHVESEGLSSTDGNIAECVIGAQNITRGSPIGAKQMVTDNIDDEGQLWFKFTRHIDPTHRLTPWKLISANIPSSENDDGIR